MGVLWAQFKDLIFEFLKFIYSGVGDWGLSIIVLTALVRLALMPLTIKQTKSMYELQRIQPKIKELQTKYANDKEKQQEETMKFYQENKINPLGGCLPMILQMPLLIALYGVLGGNAKKPGNMLVFFQQNPDIGRQFLFFIKDIAQTPSAVFSSGGLVAALPYIVLVAIFGISVWLPQALMPGEKQQKMIGLYMAVFMLFFGWSAPAGVLLYWDLSSIWGIVQQQTQMKLLKREHPEESVLEPGEPLAKKANANKSSAGKKNKTKKS